jgi:hypothetical protein
MAFGKNTSGTVRAMAPPMLCTIVAMIAVFCLTCQTLSAAAKSVSPNTESPGEFSISADKTDPDYTQDYVPQEQPEREYIEINNGRLALYYEMVMLFFALAIGIGAIVCRERTSREIRVSDFSRPTGEKPYSQVSQIRS